MNEAETRAEHIDPALKAAGWGVVEGSRVLREHGITAGRLQGAGQRARAEIADYVLVYRNTQLAVVEAKAWDKPCAEGVAQAKSYALFLADRNILADQAYNAFSAFPDDALVRIAPDEIKRKGRVPKNGSIFFTIFQTFMSGPGGTPYFGDYPPDFFDLIIIDECHRGGANEESTWRDILTHFSPAVQLGLTATPKRTINADTYAYFGDPVFVYSLKDGINDGFLTPFRVKQIATTMDEYIYTADDEVLLGQVEQGRRYEEKDFNRVIQIKDREAHRVKLMLDMIDQREKTIVFCATQAHAALVRDLINQHAKRQNPLYCARVTANDGALGEQHLRDFQDNEKTIPTVLTTSHKLTTGVDARNVRNIMLLRPVNSMIEFKQIIGRGTRLYDGKDYFTILDFVKAHHLFSDPEWDGEPIEPTEPTPRPPRPPVPDGKPLSPAQFLESLFGVLPEFFKDEDQLRALWADPTTRKGLLDGLAEKGFGREPLAEMQRVIDAANSDLFDVLAYVAFALPTLTTGRCGGRPGATRPDPTDVCGVSAAFVCMKLGKPLPFPQPTHGVRFHRSANAWITSNSDVTQHTAWLHKVGHPG